VNIGVLPTNDEIRSSAQKKFVQPNKNPLKLTVEPLPDGTRESLGIDKGGVLVGSVESGGPAEKAGIRSGDVISMIDNKAVDSSEDVSSVLSELERKLQHWYCIFETGVICVRIWSNSSVSCLTQLVLSLFVLILMTILCFEIRTMFAFQCFHVNKLTSVNTF